MYWRTRKLIQSTYSAICFYYQQQRKFVLTPEINNMINQTLNIALRELLLNAENNQAQRENTRALGIGEPHLVPFVTGIIYATLQERFNDESERLLHRNPTIEDLANIFVPYWRTQIQHIQTELQRIYRL